MRELAARGAAEGLPSRRGALRAGRLRGRRLLWQRLWRRGALLVVPSSRRAGRSRAPRVVALLSAPLPRRAPVAARRVGRCAAAVVVQRRHIQRTATVLVVRNDDEATGRVAARDRADDPRAPRTARRRRRRRAPPSRASKRRGRRSGRRPADVRAALPELRARPGGRPRLLLPRPPRPRPLVRRSARARPRICRSGLRETRAALARDRALRDALQNRRGPHRRLLPRLELRRDDATLRVDGVERLYSPPYKWKDPGDPHTHIYD
mmetsp:Transcript_20149/g.80403  ORF Transcript_20149/g.80403 Transcript_20149/m.80403 type:complete len:265 (+) Transcript_20149:337-1131(+)